MWAHVCLHVYTLNTLALSESSTVHMGLGGIMCSGQKHFKIIATSHQKGYEKHLYFEILK